MPRIELVSEEQVAAFNHWIYGKIRLEQGIFLTAVHRPGEHVARAYEIDGEPLVLWSSDENRFDKALVSERHASELEEAGVVFDRSRGSRPKDQPDFITDERM